MKESNMSETEEERKGLREGEKKRVRGEQQRDRREYWFTCCGE